MAYNNFYDLDVWKEARRFKNLIYDIVKGFPKSERYGLTDQLIRAVRSIPANLAEGHGRQTVKDELHFCIMARGSWSESLNHLIDAKDCGLLSFEMLGELKGDWDRLGRILSGYINYLRSQTSKPTIESKVSEEGIKYDTENLTETGLTESELDAFRRAIDD